MVRGVMGYEGHVVGLEDRTKRAEMTEDGLTSGQPGCLVGFDMGPQPGVGECLGHHAKVVLQIPGVHQQSRRLKVVDLHAPRAYDGLAVRASTMAWA